MNYEFRFGGGVTQQSTNGQTEYSYMTEGTNSYTVYVYAYSITGHYTSTFQTFDLFVEGFVFEWLEWNGTNKNDWFFVLWWGLVVVWFLKGSISLYQRLKK